MSFRAALAEHLAAIDARDVARFAATVGRGPDVRVIGPDGSAIVGYDAIVEAHRGWFAVPGWRFAAQVVMQRAGDTLAFALLDVTYGDGDGDGDGTRRFLLSVVFAREDGEWKLYYDQNTPYAQA